MFGFGFKNLKLIKLDWFNQYWTKLVQPTLNRVAKDQV
jgi:hypothetical protein